MEYIFYGITLVLGYFFGNKKRTLENKKLEVEIMNLGAEVWGSIKDDLMDQIKALKLEIQELKEENQVLRAEIIKLQGIISNYNNSN